MDSAGRAIETESTLTVSFPPEILNEIKRIAAEENWPESKAVILLTKLGVKAQQDAENPLRSAHKAFVDETEPIQKHQRADEMIRSIFGPASIG